MKDKLVSFETAKLAKEKGFWIASYKCYDNTGFLNDTCNDEAVSFKYDYRTLPSKDKYCTPTQSLLQKWLREKHNCDVIVTPFAGCEINYGYYIYHNPQYKVKPIINEWGYEQALEKGLQEALKLI